jgi:3',5'-cyclic AMP phosphodiesterase CpdA
LNLRLLHLSDIHFGAENVEALGAATAFAEAIPFDLMVISGDVTQLGAPAEFAAAAAWLSRLPGPHLTLPGNHDTPWFGLVERVCATSPWPTGSMTWPRARLRPWRSSVR